MCNIESGGGRVAIPAFPGREHVFQGLTRGFNFVKIHRARRALETVGSAEYGGDNVELHLRLRLFLQLE